MDGCDKQNTRARTSMGSITARTLHCHHPYLSRGGCRFLVKGGGSCEKKRKIFLLIFIRSRSLAVISSGGGENAQETTE